MFSKFDNFSLINYQRKKINRRETKKDIYIYKRRQKLMNTFYACV